MKVIEHIVAAVAPNGLRVCGAFNAFDHELPALPDGQLARSLVLIGTSGSSFWAAFIASDEFKDGMEHPLDRWSQRLGEELATKVHGHAVFPFGGPPYQPFLKWAQRAESLQPSKTGMLMHPEFGLWHAFRFALLLSQPVPESESPPQQADICASCVATPCQKTCPVNAFTADGYNLKACFEYLRNTPDADCHTLGCVARRSCPQAPEYAYLPDHARFHMDAFVAATAKRFEQD